MCGRFVGFRKIEELLEYFPINKIEEADEGFMARYNIAPTHEVLVIKQKDGINHLKRMHWGLVPFWAEDMAIGNKLINARAETVAIKPSFRHAFKHQRCLVLADGFYEWAGKKGDKQPMYITLPDEKPFAFAGLWDRWDNRGKNDITHESCAIITIPASESIAHIHNRMPAVLNPEMYAAWLDANFNDTKQLDTILHQGILQQFSARPVSKKVGSVKNNDPSNIQKSLPGF